MAKKKASKRGGARPGAGRPRSNTKHTVVSARVPIPLAKKLERWSKANGVTCSKAAAEAIRQMVE